MKQAYQKLEFRKSDNIEEILTIPGVGGLLGFLDKRWEKCFRCFNQYYHETIVTA